MINMFFNQHRKDSNNCFECTHICVHFIYISNFFCKRGLIPIALTEYAQAPHRRRFSVSV